jgi:NHLM bacteriocin system ABC transporter peptidase/ATP-binding protein
MHGADRPVKTPVILQMEAVECGAAALAIVLGYHSLYLPLERIRADCGISRDGSRALNLLKAARGYGMETRALKKEPADLKDLPMPVILHWNFNHFIVLEGISPKGVFLNDPASGRRRISLDELNTSFTGIVLLITPGPSFSPGGSPPSVLQAIIPKLKPEVSSILFLVLAGVAMLIPGIVFPAATQIFIDTILLGTQEEWLVPLLAFMLFFLIIQFLVIWLRESCIARWNTHLSLRLSTTFFHKILFLPLTFFDQRYIGEIASRVRLNDQIALIISNKVAFALLDLIISMVYLAILFWYSIPLTLIAVTAALINLVFLLRLSRWRKDSSTKLLMDQGKLSGVAVSGLQAIESIKASGREGDFFEKWAGYHARYLNSDRTMRYSSTVLAVFSPFITQFGITAAFSLGSVMILSGSMSIGYLFAYQAMLLNFLMPVQRLVGLGGEIQSLAGDIQRIQDVEKNVIDHGMWDVQTDEKYFSAGGQQIKLHGYLDLVHLTFGYNSFDPPIFADLNIRVKPGEQVALVGPSGCGKSTIARLTAGLYQPWSGEIMIDRTPYDRIPPAVRFLSVSFVSQDIFLFEGTIRENITLWDKTLTDVEIIVAAKDAEIHDFITTLPGGYDFRISEGGRNLSGGQRQRLEIARALAGSPSILILDEATSALDPITEKKIEQNLRMRGCACLIIAHRLSTIRDCESIIVLQKGEIVEQGTHEQMMKSKGAYYQLIMADESESPEGA